MPRKNSNVTHIAVHTTATAGSFPLCEAPALPFHFAIFPSGRIVSVRRVTPGTTVIRVAWVGGRDKDGQPADNRTDQQCRILFNTLVSLCERCPKALIVAAERLNSKDSAGFDLHSWLAAYVPEYLEAV